MITAFFYLNNQEAQRDQTTTLHFHHFFQSYLFDSKIEQIAYVLSPSHGIAQKTILARLTLKQLASSGEVQNSAHSFPISGQLNN